MYFNNNLSGWNGYTAPMWINHQSVPPYQSWNGYQNQPQAMVPMPYSSVPINTPTLDIGSDFNGKKMVYPGYKIRQGDKGEVVKAIQQRMGLPADGVYTPQVEAMVRRFQADNKVEINGVVGPETWKKMFGSLDSFSTFSVRNDTEKDAIIVWTAKKCRGNFYGIPNVCHYELVLPDQVQTYEFEDKTSDRRVGILRKGSYRTLPISANVPENHEFTVSSLRSSGVKLSRSTSRRNDGDHRREFVNRMQAMMNGVVSGVKERLPFL